MLDFGRKTAAGETTLMIGFGVGPAAVIGRCDMTASLALLYVTFVAGVAVLAAAWAWGDPPEQGYQFVGRSPLQPDLRYVLVVEEASDDVHHTPVAPLGRHA